MKEKEKGGETKWPHDAEVEMESISGPRVARAAFSSSGLSCDLVQPACPFRASVFPSIRLVGLKFVAWIYWGNVASRWL